MQTRRCCHKDRVNGFIFSSPVYLASATEAMISFVDRVFFAGEFNTSTSFGGKPAASIISCRRAGSTATLDQLNKDIVFNGMSMVPSQYWNLVHGNTPEEVERFANNVHAHK